MDFFSNRFEDLHLLDPHIPLPILRGFALLHKRNQLLDHVHETRRNRWAGGGIQVSRDYLHGWSLLRLDDPYSWACDGLTIDDLDVLSLP